jgi:hypothetical protein
MLTLLISFVIAKPNSIILGNRHPEKNKHGAFIPKNMVKLLADKTDKSFHCFFYLKFKVSGFEVVKPKIIFNF